MVSIKKSSDYTLVAKHGHRWFSDSFIIQIHKRDDRLEEDSRLGLIVSKKLGNAVVRNLVKRRFREIFKSTFPPEIKGLDVVLIGRKSSKEREFKQLEADMRWSIKRLGLTQG